MRYGFVIDQRKCIGCHACTVACKEENQVPLGVNRTWVKYIEKGTFPDTRRFFSVMRCNHCDNAPCVTICPTVALYRRPDGIVDFDGDRCIGCKSCMQACPYDALYIDPETQTAAKCHYCAHRVEVGLEPACVIVCPVEAIVPGDLDDPGSRIARLVASQQVAVRKPERGTQPKLFYLGADEAALTPSMQERGERYLFAEASRIPVPGGRSVAGAAAPIGEAGVDLLRMARTVYDVAHPERPWGWKVSTYLWTKAIAAGSLLIAITGPAWSMPAAIPALISLVFLALTVLLLTFDLKRPERFLYLFLKPNWRSWLVWGGFILLAFGGLASLWLLGALWNAQGLLLALAAPTVILALMAAGYSAFLFGQATGRDFWQSGLFLPHLIVSAMAAGNAALLLPALWLYPADLEYLVPPPKWGLATSLAVFLLLHLALVLSELFAKHPTVDGARAARFMRKGTMGRRLWVGVVLGGVALPLILLGFAGQSWCLALAALLALGGLWLWEDIWIRAGQAVPLS